MTSPLQEGSAGSEVVEEGQDSDVRDAGAAPTAISPDDLLLAAKYLREKLNAAAADKRGVMLSWEDAGGIIAVFETIAKAEETARVRCGSCAWSTDPQEGWVAIALERYAADEKQRRAGVRDSARLDWMERQGHSVMHFGDQRWQAHDVARTGLRAAIDEARARTAPCDHCGYNGPGFFQPDTHPCITEYAAPRGHSPDHASRSPLPENPPNDKA